MYGCFELVEAVRGNSFSPWEINFKVKQILDYKINMAKYFLLLLLLFYLIFSCVWLLEFESYQSYNCIAFNFGNVLICFN